MRRIFGRKLKDEKGATLLWVAGSLVALLAVSAFAVDLGWVYLNSTRAQQAADSAALAGVVNLPSFVAQAQTDAENAAAANDFPIGGTNTLVATPLPENKLHVELRTQIPTFFLKVVGINTMSITREATAQYVLPVPLGSPSRCFGQDPTGTYCPANINDFWAAVSAPYTFKRDGDPYSTNCLDTSTSATSCASSNVEYARGGLYTGYYFAVELQATATSQVDVAIYDARFNQRPSYPTVETADARFSPGNSNPGVRTSFQLHALDTTPNSPGDTAVLAGCTWNLAPNSNTYYQNQWRILCSLPAGSPAGVYPLHVFSSGNGSGTNQYSVAASTGSGPQPRVYGINDMSIFSNNLTGPSNLYLAEIDPVHAGKTLELRFFDAGDASGLSYMRVRDPFGNIPNCTWFSEDSSGTITGSGSGSCEWLTTTSGGTRIYNNEWITAEIDISSGYDCGPTASPSSTDCFWRMELDLSQPNERTTWTARVIGNPVQLVP